MNILFISFDSDPPHQGGVSTITNVLAKEFIALGHFCALGFMDNSEHPSVFFKHKVKLVENNQENIEKFFKEHHFDIILNQLPTLTNFKFILSLPLNNCKIISVYHSRPMFHFELFEILLRIYSDSNNILNKIYTLAKIPLLPLFWIISRKKQINKFNDINSYSDKIVLLSKNFFSNWLSLSPYLNANKLIAIGNPLVFEHSMQVANLIEKEKKVIVLYSNPSKRAHIWLEIWSKIENDSRLEDWQLDFIGDGEGFNKMQKLAIKLKLNRVNFVGYKDPYLYYKKASIMMMTSKYEGWPMVLMEGQQMGVIPICYNSFESLTEIINDDENGLIIANNDMNGFVIKMKELMLNEKRINRMATDAIFSSDRFTKDKVTKQYLELFSDLVDDNL